MPTHTPAQIRQQLDLMEEVRDRAARLSGDYFDEWMDALVPLTDKLIRDLHEAECEAAGVPTNPWHHIHGAGVAWEDWA